MCLVALAWHHLPGMPLCLISNRDEFHARPTAGLASWRLAPPPASDGARTATPTPRDRDIPRSTAMHTPEAAERVSHLPAPRDDLRASAAPRMQRLIIGGRDLQSGGTWLGITPGGRWAVLTNFRDARDPRRFSTSRGTLVTDFLAGDLSPLDYQRWLANRLDDYAGFNLIVGTLESAVYLGNGGAESRSPEVLTAGMHVLCNGQKSDPWAKSEHIRQRFTNEFIPWAARSGHPARSRHETCAISPHEEGTGETGTKPRMDAGAPAWLRPQDDAHEHGQTHRPSPGEQDERTRRLEAHAWKILEDTQRQPDDRLPDTGIGLDRERLLSSTFIRSDSLGYGTRCSNLLTLSDEGAWHFSEKTQHGPERGLVRRWSGPFLP